ncbi:MAG TPA: hypothetical protein VJ729_03410 [Nitrososphaeraceae archaeon]|nr:hypothetical protein [Nitrososphaeraceae archaeon]
MVGRNPRFDIAIIITGVLEKKYPRYMRYKELEKEVNLSCKGRKPSTATFIKYLDMLCGIESQYLTSIYKGVLIRKLEENRSTHYSLTKEFKESLDKRKKESPTTYIQDTLCLPKFSENPSSEKAIEITDN